MSFVRACPSRRKRRLNHAVLVAQRPPFRCVIGWRTSGFAVRLRVVRDCIRGGGCPLGVKPHAWNMHAHADAIV